MPRVGQWNPRLMRVTIHNHLTRDSGTYRGKTVEQWRAMEDRALDYAAQLLKQYNEVAPTGSAAFARRRELMNRSEKARQQAGEYATNARMAEAEVDQKVEQTRIAKRQTPAGPHWRKGYRL